MKIGQKLIGMESVLTTIRRKRSGIILIFGSTVLSIANTTWSHFDRYESRAVFAGRTLLSLTLGFASSKVA